MYDEKYYKKHQDGSYQSAQIILRLIYTITAFQTVIDYGCGIGTWGKAAKSLGVSRYVGIDQNPYDATYMLINSCNYIQQDLQEPINLKSRFDLTICVEVAEHIPKGKADILLDNVCQNSEVVLFSAALVGQGGTGHINEQPCSYWIEKFSVRGYVPVDCIRPTFWNDEEIEIWYRNNCMLYMTPKALNQFQASIPRISPPTDIIHPKMLNRILHKRGLK